MIPKLPSGNNFVLVGILSSVLAPCVRSQLQFSFLWASNSVKWSCPLLGRLGLVGLEWYKLPNRPTFFGKKGVLVARNSLRHRPLPFWKPSRPPRWGFRCHFGRSAVLIRSVQKLSWNKANTNEVFKKLF